MEDASEAVVGSEDSSECPEFLPTFSPGYAAPANSSNRQDASRLTEDLPDETVVTSAIAGNTEAFDVLVRRYHSVALRTAALIVGADLAEDVVQDAFLLAFLALPMIRDRAKFPRWLSTITRFRALRLRRSESHRRTETVALDAARLAMLSNIVCAPREEMEGDEILRSALDRIPPEYAEVLRLHFLHGMAHQKIAELLTVPLSTVKWRCFRGKQMIRCIVHPEGCDPKRVADACRDCPSRAAWCRRESREPLRIASNDSASARRRGKARIPALGVDLGIWAMAFWPASRMVEEVLPDVLPDFLSDLLPDVLPDLVADVLPDFLSDLLALLVQ